MMKNNKNNDLSLDEVFIHLKSYQSKRKIHKEKKVNDLIAHLDLNVGGLYQIEKDLPWICGNVDDLNWFKNANNDLTPFVVFVEKDSVVCFIGAKLIHWHDVQSKPNWLWFLSFIVGNKVGYFPVPHLLFENKYNVARNECKELFNKVQYR